MVTGGSSHCEVGGSIHQNPPPTSQAQNTEISHVFLPRSAEFWFFCSRAFARVRPDFLFRSPSPTQRRSQPRSKVAKWDFSVFLAHFKAVRARARSLQVAQHFLKYYTPLYLCVRLLRLRHVSPCAARSNVRTLTISRGTAYPRPRL